MNRPARLIIAGALLDLGLTSSITAGDLGRLPHLADAAWFPLDAVALALVALGLWRSGPIYLPFAVGWVCFAVAHVVIGLDPDLAGPLLAAGDILIAVTGTLSTLRSVRADGWNARSKLLLAAALSVFVIPLAVAVSGDAGLDLALPFYSLVLIALGIGLTRLQAQRALASVTV